MLKLVNKTVSPALEQLGYSADDIKKICDYIDEHENIEGAEKLSDEIRMLGEELIRSKRLDDIHIGLDFFDASINRVGAWIIGTRAILKSLLLGLLEPYSKMLAAEESGSGLDRSRIIDCAQSRATDS